jgi:hypothetical protein
LQTDRQVSQDHSRIGGLIRSTRRKCHLRRGNSSRHRSWSRALAAIVNPILLKNLSAAEFLLRTSATMVWAQKSSCNNRQAAVTAQVPYPFPLERKLIAILKSHFPDSPGSLSFWARMYPSFSPSRSMIQIGVSALRRCCSSHFPWVSSEIKSWFIDWDRTSSALRIARRKGPSWTTALRNVNAAVAGVNRLSLPNLPARRPAEHQVPMFRGESGL